MSPLASWLASALIAGICLTSAPQLSAQEPSCDATCPRGFSCELVEICSSGPEFRETPDVCETNPVCTALPCSTDADCDENMRCYQQPSAESPARCAPRWLTHCSADADCGDGFSCAEELPCLDPTAEDAATCTPEGELVCFIHTQGCQSDSDCSAGWTCDNNPINAFWASTNGAMGCNVFDPALICKPPFSQAYGLGAGYLDWQTGTDWTKHVVPPEECPAPITHDNDFLLRDVVGDDVDGRVVVINEQGVASPTTSVGEASPNAMSPEATSSAASGGSGCAFAIAGNSAQDVSRALGLVTALSLVTARLRSRQRRRA